jgi:hypothetical protein
MLPDLRDLDLIVRSLGPSTLRLEGRAAAMAQGAVIAPAHLIPPLPGCSRAHGRSAIGISRYGRPAGESGVALCHCFVINRSSKRHIFVTSSPFV